MFDNFVPYKTKEQKLSARRSNDMKYTYNYREGKIPSPVLSRRKAAELTVPALTIETDVNTKIKNVENILRVRSPRPVQHHVLKEIRDSEKRIKRVRAGISINKVFAETSEPIPLQTVPKSNFMSEEESIRPFTSYIAPQTEPRPHLYNVHPPATASVGDRAANSVEGILYQITEDDRKRDNEIITNINRRNARRFKNIKAQYDNSLKYGMEEAQKRARRGAALSALKEKRTEYWWADFINEFPVGDVSPEQLVILKHLSKATFTEPGIIAFIQEADARNWSNYYLRIIMKAANDHGHFMNPIRLGMLLKSGQEHKISSQFSTISLLTLKV